MNSIYERPRPLLYVYAEANLHHNLSRLTDTTGRPYATITTQHHELHCDHFDEYG
jgi:hypothetical protein